MPGKSTQQQAPKGLQDAKSLAALVGMSEADVRSLTKKGVLSAQDGLYDPARALVSITRHLVKTRDTAEAKARTERARAEVEELKLKAATEREQKRNAEPDDEPAPNRKTKRSKRLEEKILRGLEQGLSLRRACDGEINEAQVLRWVKSCLDFAQQYARAREIGWFGKVDRILDLIEEAHKAALDTECGGSRLVAIKLEIDTLKWLLCKMLPKVYGDKAQVVEVVGVNTATGAATSPAVQSDEAESIVQAIAERQARLMRMQAAEEAEDESNG